MVFVVVGSAQQVDLVWNLSDMFNGLMVIPNLLGLLALSSIVVKLAQDRDNTRLTSEHFEDNTERRETTND